MIRLRTGIRPICVLAMAVLLQGGAAGAGADADTAQALPAPVSVSAAARQLAVGDLVFIRVPALPFRQVASATGSWTNHVGIVIDVAGAEPLIAESTFPLSRTGTFPRFVARSEAGRFAVMRPRTPLDARQQEGIRKAALRRTGILYDTGFDLHSRGQFCSRYVREVLEEATGVSVGEVQTFADLLAAQPGLDLQFWRLWYFGRIPMARPTVTPASILASPLLHAVLDGRATPADSAIGDKS